MLQSEENITDENCHASSFEVTNLNRALSQFHLYGTTNQRQPLRPSKQICILKKLHQNYD